MNEILNLLTAAKAVEIVSFPNKKWSRILQEMGIDDHSNTIQITAFWAKKEFFQALEKMLKANFENVDTICFDKHWEKIYICKNDDRVTIICASWYRTGIDPY
jgi:hypothetical protein